MKMEIVDRKEGMMGSDRDTLFMLGGAALVIVGAGMILSNPSVRKYVSNSPIGGIVNNLIPDVERYFRLRSM
ncbi:MAG TPA: hypothetical protein VIM00_06110 [Candidatus Acidoferrum sp.]|jgi:hypothetical protein